MREIKFRAWDKNKNCWFKPVYEAYKGNLFDLFIELSGNMVVHTSKGIEGNFINSDNNIKFWSGMGGYSLDYKKICIDEINDIHSLIADYENDYNIVQDEKEKDWFKEQIQIDRTFLC